MSSVDSSFLVRSCKLDTLSMLGQIEQKAPCNPLVYVGGGLSCGHVDGQLVDHAFQRVGRRHRCQEREAAAAR